MEANFRETQLANVRVGQSVDISVDALPGIKLKGRVDSLGPASGVSFSPIPRIMPPATSPRSCSVCRCVYTWTRDRKISAGCASACPYARLLIPQRKGTGDETLSRVDPEQAGRTIFHGSSSATLP